MQWENGDEFIMVLELDAGKSWRVCANRYWGQLELRQVQRQEMEEMVKVVVGQAI